MFPVWVVLKGCVRRDRSEHASSNTKKEEEREKGKEGGGAGGERVPHTTPAKSAKKHKHKREASPSPSSSSSSSDSSSSSSSSSESESESEQEEKKKKKHHHKKGKSKKKRKKEKDGKSSKKKKHKKGDKKVKKSKKNKDRDKEKGPAKDDPNIIGTWSVDFLHRFVDHTVGPIPADALRKNGIDGARASSVCAPDQFSDWYGVPLAAARLLFSAIQGQVQKEERAKGMSKPRKKRVVGQPSETFGEILGSSMIENSGALGGTIAFTTDFKVAQDVINNARWAKTGLRR